MCTSDAWAISSGLYVRKVFFTVSSPYERNQKLFLLALCVFLVSYAFNKSKPLSHIQNKCTLLFLSKCPWTVWRCLFAWKAALKPYCRPLFLYDRKTENENVCVRVSIGSELYRIRHTCTNPNHATNTKISACLPYRKVDTGGRSNDIFLRKP